MSASECFITPGCFPDNVVAYTSTRCGGVSGKALKNNFFQGAGSTGDYLGLNVGAHVGDDIINVSQNRARLPYSERITWLEQRHGSTVVTLPSVSVIADASFSSSSAHFCAVMTADCVPVLISDRNGKEVAAIHAGWKGIEANIISNAVAYFSSKPSQLIAWIGPAICGQCYEVNETLAAKFLQYKNSVKPKTEADKYCLDLPHIANQQLTHIGVSQIEQSHLCTYCRSDWFYSHRKATHNKYAATGRIVSVIGLR
jgi:YfiH family protein